MLLTLFQTFHCNYPRKTSFTKLDPSCTIGFYVRHRIDFEHLCLDLIRVRNYIFLGSLASYSELQYVYSGLKRELDRNLGKQIQNIYLQNLKL